MRSTTITLLALAAAALLSGCTTMAKQAVSEIRGAHGKIVVVRDAPRVFYTGLSGVTVGQVANTIAPVCPPQMHGMIEQALRQRAAEASVEMDGQGGACTLDVDVQFYNRPGGALAMLGKGALLIGRARVLDGEAQQVADLLVVVSSRAIRTKAREVAETFAKLLLKHLTETGDQG